MAAHGLDEHLHRHGALLEKLGQAGGVVDKARERFIDRRWVRHNSQPSAAAESRANLFDHRMSRTFIHFAFSTSDETSARPARACRGFASSLPLRKAGPVPSRLARAGASRGFA